MADGTKIEWTNATWNPLRARNLRTGKVGWHCEHATMGCELCYAERMNEWRGTGLPFKPGHRKDVELFLDDGTLAAPLRWKKPRMVFVCSMTDLFADFVEDEWIDKVFAVMALARRHTFQVLTKRSARMREAVARMGRSIDVLDRQARLLGHSLKWAPPPELHDGAPIGLVPWPLPNVWMGVSAERQQEADERIPELLRTPAAVRFVSAEPLIAPIDLTMLRASPPSEAGVCRTINALTGERGHVGPCGWTPAVDRRAEKLSWSIVGGESGPGHRPMQLEWAADILRQCRDAGVAAFFKQMAGKAPIPPELMVREFPR